MCTSRLEAESSEGALSQEAVFGWGAPLRCCEWGGTLRSKLRRGGGSFRSAPVLTAPGLRPGMPERRRQRSPLRAGGPGMDGRERRTLRVSNEAGGGGTERARASGILMLGRLAMGLVVAADTDPAAPGQLIVAAAGFVFGRRPTVHRAEQVHQLQGPPDGHGGIRPGLAAFLSLLPFNGLPPRHHAAHVFPVSRSRGLTQAFRHDGSITWGRRAFGALPLGWQDEAGDSQKKIGREREGGRVTARPPRGRRTT